MLLCVQTIICIFCFPLSRWCSRRCSFGRCWGPSLCSSTVSIGFLSSGFGCFACWPSGFCWVRKAVPVVGDPEARFFIIIFRDHGARLEGWGLISVARASAGDELGWHLRGVVLVDHVEIEVELCAVDGVGGDDAIEELPLVEGVVVIGEGGHYCAIHEALQELDQFSLVIVHADPSDQIIYTPHIPFDCIASPTHIIYPHTMLS